MARRLTLDFLRTEATAGVILALSALAGIVAANSPWRPYYFAFLAHPLPVRLGGWSETLSTLDWVKEGLMAVFFFVVGLEIKFEAMRGELSSPRKLALPVIAAAGGMAAPALVYLAVNLLVPAGQPQGWPAPTATDIAFAVAALAVAGRGAPAALRTFLLALAVADDLGAVVLIGVLFTKTLHAAALAEAVALVGVLALMSRWRQAPASLYLAVCAVLWALTLRSGISPSVAGVAAAATIPLEPRRSGERGVLERVSAALHPYVAYAILPLFAFCAAGFSLRHLNLAEALGPVPIGVALGLLVGKPLGVFGATVAAVKLKLAHRPAGAGWGDLFAAALLCGIGFTMSLFLGGLAFPDSPTGAGAGVKLGVATGSVGATLFGALALARNRVQRRGLKAAGEL